MSEFNSKQPSYSDKRNVANKAHLIEPIIRHRIQDSIFYKQYLYLTNEATILPVIIEHIQFISGTDSVGRPSPFISCLFRLLELAPSPEIVQVYTTQLEYNEFKYLTALILMYIRITGSSEEVYSTLDSYYGDFRKLRVKLKNPEFNEVSLPIHYKLTFIDEWVDSLLVQDRVVDLILPRLIPRSTLVERELVKPREYHIEIDAEGSKEDDEENKIDEEGSGEDSYESDSD